MALPKKFSIASEAQIGASFITHDSSATPKTSPLAYSSSVLTIDVPTNAAEIVLKPSTDLRISEVSTGSPYFLINSSTTQAISVGSTDKFYIVRDASDGTLNFYFVTL